MRLTGTLRSWKDDRGFGFIAPARGGVELFVHISALPSDGTRPTVGEKLTYELGRGKSGQLQAINVQRHVIGRMPERARARSPAAKNSPPVFTKLIVLVILVAVGAFAFNQYQQRLATPSSQPELLMSRPESVNEVQNFKCDGRTHCAQMTSCAEAKYFLKNCPGTRMDGNNDGTPCERQWCTTLFSR